MSIATQTGATIETIGDSFDAEDAFLTRMKGAEKLPKENEPEPEEDEREPDAEDEATETHEETPSDDEEESERDEETEGEENDDDEDDKDKAKEAKSEDDVIVKIKVGDKEHQVPVKDLKRLFGQEATLTRKSQEVADARKNIEAIGAKQTVALESMMKRAQERAQPYAQLDFLALAKDPNISVEELTALRNEAQRSFDDVNFYGQELDTVMKGQQAQRTETLRTQAVEAHKVLNDPKLGIEGWNQSMYNDIRSFAITNGLQADFVNEITDPNAIKLLHKAMQFDKGRKALSKTTTVVKTPKKIIKSSSSETSTNLKPQADQKSRERLAKSGSVDDAADLFLARMNRK